MSLSFNDATTVSYYFLTISSVFGYAVSGAIISKPMYRMLVSLLDRNRASIPADYTTSSDSGSMCYASSIASTRMAFSALFYCTFFGISLAVANMAFTHTLNFSRIDLSYWDDGYMRNSVRMRICNHGAGTE